MKTKRKPIPTVTAWQVFENVDEVLKLTTVLHTVASAIREDKTGEKRYTFAASIEAIAGAIDRPLYDLYGEAESALHEVEK